MKDAAKPVVKIPFKCDELFEKHSAKRIVDADIAAAISERRIFPCSFGSALKTDGVSDFIACLSHYSRERGFKKDFAARVYKITYDPP